MGLCFPMSTMAILSASLPKMRSDASTWCQARTYAKAVCCCQCGASTKPKLRTLPTACDMQPWSESNNGHSDSAHLMSLQLRYYEAWSLLVCGINLDSFHNTSTSQSNDIM